jgi:alcohol dehydrogenase class IV
MPAAMGHPLSAILGKAHGQTLATLLPHIMAFNMPVRADKYALVAQAFGVAVAGDSDEANGAKAIQAVAKLSISVGTAKSITQMGGDAASVDLAVSQALTDPCMMSTAVTASGADIRLVEGPPLLLPASNPHLPLYQSRAIQG